jgi:nucleoside 2-deoxyribosyltransferase
MEIQSCPVCLTNVNSIVRVGDRDTDAVDCPRCGKFEISDSLKDVLSQNKIPKRQRYIASSLIRENSYEGFMLHTYNCADFFNSRCISVLKRVDRLLLHAEQSAQYANLHCNLNINSPELSAITWSNDAEEVKQLITLAIDMEYLKKNVDGDYSIAYKGWERLAALQEANPTSQQGFVAMCFDNTLEQCYKEAIEPGIIDAGYQPLRIDKSEHINKIDDEVILQIRRSRFLVADLTKDRGNVYYEAGFAHGLSIPVFYTAKRDKKVHFDVDHYNRIQWAEDNLKKFRDDLSKRIEAHLGRGSAPKS